MFIFSISLSSNFPCAYIKGFLLYLAQFLPALCLLVSDKNSWALCCTHQASGLERKPPKMFKLIYGNDGSSRALGSLLLQGEGNGSRTLIEELQVSWVKVSNVFWKCSWRLCVPNESFSVSISGCQIMKIDSGKSSLCQLNIHLLCKEGVSQTLHIRSICLWCASYGSVCYQKLKNWLCQTEAGFISAGFKPLTSFL